MISLQNPLQSESLQSSSVHLTKKKQKREKEKAEGPPPPAGMGAFISRREKQSWTFLEY